MGALQLRAVNHGKGDKNRYCGPSALSAVTGMTTGEAARVIRAVTGKRQVKGTSTTALRDALKACGIQSRRLVHGRERVEYEGRDAIKMEWPTLARWLDKTVELRSSGRVFLVVAGNHWQLVSGRRYVCGLTGEVVSVKDKKVRRRARVTEVYELTANSVTRPAAADRPAKTSQEVAVDHDRRACYRLAQTHDIEIEIEREYDGRSYVHVWGPSWPDGTDEESVDPFYGDHLAESWQDALERVKAYVEVMREMGMVA